MVTRFCRKCDRDTERNAGGDCKVCDSARSAVWRAKNSDKIKAYKAEWRALNAEDIKSKHAAWVAKNADHVKAQKAAWYEKNRDQERAKRASYYSANTDKVKAKVAQYRAKNGLKLKAKRSIWFQENFDRLKASHAAWCAKNPEALRIHSQNRRARKRLAVGKISKDLASKLYKLQGGKCPCCQKPLGKNYHLDHILPLKLGGTHTDDNMQLLRSRCNLQKNATHPVDYMQSKGYLI